MHLTCVIQPVLGLPIEMRQPSIKKKRQKQNKKTKQNKTKQNSSNKLPFTKIHMETHRDGYKIQESKSKLTLHDLVSVE